MRGSVETVTPTSRSAGRWVDGDPDGFLADSDVARARADPERGDSAGSRVDPGDGAVQTVGDPDGSRADCDRVRIVTDDDPADNPIPDRVDLDDSVVQAVRDPDAALTDGDVRRE